MSSPLTAEFAATFRSQKRLAEQAIVQLTDEELRAVPADDLNSVAVIIHHLSGNMRSRFTAFLTTDGEKPTRDRDAEFVDTFTSRAQNHRHLGSRLGVPVGARSIRSWTQI